MASRIFARSMASAAKSVKPPIQLFGVDGTYANALYLASVKDSSVGASFEGLTKISNLIKEDEKVNEFLTNPALSKADRKTVIDTLASGLKLDSTVTNFLFVLSENNRLGEFNGIYKNFGLLFDAHQGVVDATITSAKPLDSKILKRLQTAIQKSSFVGDNKTLKISNTVNPDLLGGLVVEVGDKTVDLSVSARMAKLNLVLSEAV
ncbi:hypothetical protein PUMCH_000711 [Australozyma saopauloensis]|uniref:ATP synthase subunit 5, mitochondrial n=1 Tax=Australozyma saopauloensis TaxID=291208 RepID=A0AAX4H4H0_9ASCO|nr:hypothetical protein PUMCH_000711 [[Candida] saopauloensis]